jgi:hypothetical protein
MKAPPQIGPASFWASPVMREAAVVAALGFAAWALFMILVHVPARTGLQMRSGVLVLVVIALGLLILYGARA